MYRNGIVESTPQRILEPLSVAISPGYPSAIIAVAAGTKRPVSEDAAALASASTATTSTNKSGTVKTQST